MTQFIIGVHNPASLVSEGHGHVTLTMAALIGCLEAVQHLVEAKKCDPNGKYSRIY